MEELFTYGYEQIKTIESDRTSDERNNQRIDRTDTTNIKTNDVRYIKIVGVYGSRRPVIGEIEVYRSLEENAERKETTYTVNYVDTEGTPVAESKTESGYVGYRVTETAATVDGYLPDEETSEETQNSETNTNNNENLE